MFCQFSKLAKHLHWHSQMCMQIGLHADESSGWLQQWNSMASSANSHWNNHIAYKYIYLLVIKQIYVLAFLFPYFLFTQENIYLIYYVNGRPSYGNIHILLFYLHVKKYSVWMRAILYVIDLLWKRITKQAKKKNTKKYWN